MTDQPARYPPVPQGVFGICEDCGAVAWELLAGRSTLCMGCDPTAYRDHEDEDDCSRCDGIHCYCEDER